MPSPLFRERFRTVQRFERPGLKHQQVGVHLPLMYMIQLSERVQVSLSAGPTWFRLRHDAVTAVDRGPEIGPTFINRIPSYETSLTGLTTTVEEGTAIGYNAGFDVTYLLIRGVGVGLYLRYSGGAVEIELPEGPRSIDVGGPQAGVGLRFRF